MKKGSRFILALIGVLLLVIFPVFVKTPYILHILIMTFYIGAASLAWSILGGLTGQTSLGHAAFMGFGAYISAVLVINLNISPWVSFLIAFFVVGCLSIIMFYPCFILRGPYFTLVTIAFGETFRNLFMNWNLVGKGAGLTLPFGQNSFFMMRFMGKEPYYYIALVLIAIFYFIVRRIDKNKIGYAFKTIREDEDTANAIGINTMRYKLLAAFISTGLTAVTGVFYAQYLRFIDPDIMLQTYSVEFVLPAVIGGVGNVSGALLGGLILTPLSEYLRSNLSSIIPGANLLVYAIILIVVIRFQPNGILGWYSKSKAKVKIEKVFDGIDKKLLGGAGSAKD